jgi:hypothetical protein
MRNLSDFKNRGLKFIKLFNRCSLQQHNESLIGYCNLAKGKSLILKNIIQFR